jgi:hypothetical protein
MQQFIDRYARQIDGVLTGFDRLVFGASLRRLNYGWWDANLKAFVWHCHIEHPDGRMTC